MKLAERVISFCEQIFIPKDSLGISRAKMPQIEDAKYPEFLKWLKSEGVSYKEASFTALDLKPSQNELSLEASHALVKNNPEKLKKPLLVSKDYYLLDGHHRWLAFSLYYPKAKLRIIQIDLPAKEALKKMLKFPDVVKKDIENNIL